MSLRDWLLIFAAIGFLVTESVLAQPISSNNRDQSNVAQAYDAASKRIENGLDRISAGIEDIRSAIEANKPQDPSEEEKDRLRRDLAAQEAMAAWAKSAAYAAITQTVSGFIGTALLIATLWISIGAMRAAIDQAKIARVAERPYFVPREPKLINWSDFILGKSVVLKVNFRVENIGKGVGFFVGHAVTHDIQYKEAEISTIPTLVDGIGRLPIRPEAHWGTDQAFFHVFSLEAPDITAMINYKKTLYVYGYLRYCGLDGEHWRTGFIYEFIPDQCLPTEGVCAHVSSDRWNDQKEQCKRNRRFYEFWRNVE